MYTYDWLGISLLASLTLVSCSLDIHAEQAECLGA